MIIYGYIYLSIYIYICLYMIRPYPVYKIHLPPNRLMDANNIIVVVSRWFGGTLLGPERFKFICNSARYLLEAHGYGGGVGLGDSKDRRKR